MKTIYKYQLNLVESQEIMISSVHEILHVAIRDQRIIVWAYVEDDVPMISVEFRIVGTGQEVKFNREEYLYCGTIIDEVFVWHIFKELFE